MKIGLCIKEFNFAIGHYCRSSCAVLAKLEK